jgi:hypothetical protein
MMNNYNDFINRFGVKNVHASRDRDYRTFNYHYNQTASYYADREEIIEMELTRDGFEHLVKLDREYDLLWQGQRHEAHMRRQHPAIAEAYSKYLMLMELYR